MYEGVIQAKKIKIKVNAEIYIMKIPCYSLICAIALGTSTCVPEKKESVVVIADFGSSAGAIEFDGVKYAYIYGWEAGRRWVLLIYNSKEYAGEPPRISGRGVEYKGELIVPACTDAVVLGDDGKILYRDPSWAQVEDIRSTSPQTENFAMEVLERALR
jgi:hypothetical protein